MSKVHTYYLPTFLADKEPDTGATLIVRKFQKYKSKSGKFVTKYASDAIKYPTVDDMTIAIQVEKMRELPYEAEADPNYIPKRHHSPITRRVAAL